MGKVFTWDEVQERRIPELSSFGLVLEQLKAQLSKEPSICAAGVCGSVVRGDHTCRSDIDCVVIFDAAQVKAAYSVMQMLSKFAHMLHIPLSFIENDSRMVRTRMHHLGPSFAEHMAFSLRDGGLIKGRPLEMLAPSVTREAGIEEYLRFKMHYLQAHWAAFLTFDDRERAQFLQKVLEAPLHVARKVLSWHGSLQGDSKAFILERYSTVAPENLAGKLAELVAVDRGYSAELERQLKFFDKCAYAAMLAYIEDCVPDVLEFVTENLVLIDNAPRS